MAKRIGIISDTHGVLPEEAAEILKSCDCILHAGDITKQELLDPLRPYASLYVVRGNNDRENMENLRYSLSFEIEGVKFFMVHNRKDAAWDLKDTDVVVCGHTHRYSEEMIDGRLWLNPGSCGRKQPGQGCTMAVMEASAGRWTVRKICL